MSPIKVSAIATPQLLKDVRSASTALQLRLTILLGLAILLWPVHLIVLGVLLGSTAAAVVADVRERGAAYARAKEALPQDVKVVYVVRERGLTMWWRRER